MLEKIGYYITLVTITLVPLVVLPFVLFPFVFGKILWLMTGVLVAGVVFVTGVITDRPFRARTLAVLKHPLVLAPLALFVLDCLLSLTGVDYDRTFWGDEERGMGVLQLVAMHAGFVMLAVYASTAQRKKVVLATSLFVSILVAIAALLRYTGYLLFGVDTGFRISGTIANAIFFAHAFLWYGTLAAYLAVSETKHLRLRMGGVTLAVLAVIMIFLSKTRGSFAGLLAGLSVGGVYALYYYRHTAKRIIQYGLGSILLVAVVFGLVIRFVPGTDIGRIIDFSLTETTFQTRFMAWQSGIEAWKARPLAGWGLENFSIAFDRYFNPRLTEFGLNETRFDRAHNIIVERLVTTGLLGTFAWFAMWIILLLTIHRASHLSSPQKAVLIGGIIAHLVHLMLAFDLVTSIMLWFTTLVIALPPFEHPVVLKTNGRTWVIGSVVSVLSLVGLWFLVINPIRVNRLFLVGLMLSNQGQYALVAQAHEQALAIPSPYFEMLRTDYLVNIRLFLNKEPKNVDQSLVARAVARMEEVIARHPLVSYYRGMEGSFYITEGNLEKADSLYKQGSELSPTRQEYIFQRARIALLQSKFDEADALYEQGYLLAPEVRLSQWYRAIAYISKGDDEQAKKILLPLSQKGYVPGFVDEWEVFASTLGKWGEYASSARYYLMGVNKYPNDKKILTQYAAAAYRAHQYRETYETVTRTRVLFPEFQADYLQFMQALPRDVATQPFTDSAAQEFFQFHPN